MSPRAAAEFGERWPALQRRLRAFLGGKGVPPSEIDDLVQEVAARLVAFWPKVDRDRPLWPLTVTIALNLVRDRSRRPDLEIPGELPELAGSNDAADAGIARLELAAVIQAMDSLTPPQRAALLQSIFPTDDPTPSSSAEKMLRVRARRRLANAIGRACGGVVIKTRRLTDWIHNVFARADGVTQALACTTCLLVASAGSVAAYPPLQYHAPGGEIASPMALTTSDSANATIPSTIPSAIERLSPLRSSTATSARGDAGAARGRRAGGSKASRQSAGTAAAGAGPTSGLPVPGTPPLPGESPIQAPGAPDAPSAPDTPSSPDEPMRPPGVAVAGTPSAPSQPEGDQPIGVVQDVATLVEETTR